MPYISQTDRERYQKPISEIVELLAFVEWDEGHINYVFSKIIQRSWLNQCRYWRANKILGVLEAIKLEFYRRYVAPYEDTKIEENGDL